MTRRVLLWCGVLASLVYVGVDVLAAIFYPDYHSFTSRAISELMATGAPTERLVDPLFLAYGALMMLFAVGVWASADRRRAHLTGALLGAFGAIGLLGPTLFEMNVRGAVADATADVLHIALTAVMVVFILAAVAAGASMGGRAFRLYSFVSLVVMLGFGVLTSVLAPALASDDPTPWFGLTERIDIGAFLLWVIVLALSLLRTAPRRHAPPRQPNPRVLSGHAARRTVQP